MGNEKTERELRCDPVTGAWVIVAPELARAPGQFHGRGTAGQCNLCAGNEALTAPELLAFRDHGGPNEPGWRVRVIPSATPVLRVEGAVDAGTEPHERMNGVGAHELVVETPEHDVPFSELSAGRVGEVLWAMHERMADLRHDHRLRYIAAFRDHVGGGEHGHWQMIALPILPGGVETDAARTRRYFETHRFCAICDVLREAGERAIETSAHCAVFAPYAARVPFETWIVPRSHVSHFENTSREVLDALAGALVRTARRIDSALERPAYTVTLHSAPLQEAESPHSHWRLEIAPHVARGAGRGFEWGAHMHVNPTAPEEAARFLREVVIS